MGCRYSEKCCLPVSQASLKDLGMLCAIHRRHVPVDDLQQCLRLFKLKSLRMAGNDAHETRRKRSNGWRAEPNGKPINVATLMSGALFSDENSLAKGC
ncbi:hypothetical protein Q1695_014393 [Nippostrongylus brasiliensis]|nr:hypothetical protein Q1695_014393 [Nippostrongylus brasiliensis]